MKYILLYLTTALALALPQPQGSLHLERRVPGKGKGKSKGSSAQSAPKPPTQPTASSSIDTTKSDQAKFDAASVKSTFKATKSTTSPANKVEPVTVKGSVVGPGMLYLAKSKDNAHVKKINDAIRPIGGEVPSGQRFVLSESDEKSISGQFGTEGKPKREKSALLHPSSLEGTGTSGSVDLTPPVGGWGEIKKWKNGQLVMNTNVQGGTTVPDSDRGSGPGSLKYRISCSRGGSGSITMNNPGEPPCDQTQPKP